MLLLLKCHFSLSKVSGLMINICSLVDSLGNFNMQIFIMRSSFKKSFHVDSKKTLTHKKNLSWLPLRKFQNYIKMSSFCMPFPVFLVVVRITLIDNKKGVNRSAGYFSCYFTNLSSHMFNNNKKRHQIMQDSCFYSLVCPFAFVFHLIVTMTRIYMRGH